MAQCTQGVRALEARTREAAEADMATRNALIAAREGVAPGAQATQEVFSNSRTAQLVGAASRVQDRVSTAQRVLGFFSGQSPPDERLRDYAGLASTFAGGGVRGNPVAGLVSAVGSSVIVEQHLANFRQMTAAFDEFDRFMAGIGDNPSRGYSRAYAADLARQSPGASAAAGGGLANEAARVAASLGFDPSTGGASRPLSEEAVRLEGDITRWNEEQARVAAERARAEAERQRIAREQAEQRRRQEQLAAAAAQSQRPASTPEPSRGSGSAVMGVLGALVGTAAQVYVQERYGIPMLPPSSSGSSDSPSSSSGGLDPCGADTVQRMERIMADLDRELAQLRASGAGICAQARASAAAYGRAEREAGACASAASQARDYRVQFENQARAVCAR